MGFSLRSEAAKILPSSQRFCHLGSMAAKSYFKIITLSLYVVRARSGKNFVQEVLYRIFCGIARGFRYFSLSGNRTASQYSDDAGAGGLYLAALCDMIKIMRERWEAISYENNQYARYYLY